MKRIVPQENLTKLFNISSIDFQSFELNSDVIPKLSIVMAYFKRERLLRNTLESFRKAFSVKNTFECIIVDDGSNESWEWLNDYPFRIKLIIVNKDSKKHTNSVVPYNIGFSFVSSERVIIQNPECYHLNEIIDYSLRANIENTYTSFSCYSLTEEQTSEPERFSEIKVLDKAAYRGEEGWYNHELHRKSNYHFCCLISNAALKKLGGFDQRYAFGNDFDDNEILHRIKAIGLNIDISDLTVLHQWHPHGNVNIPLHFRNKFLYEYVTSKNKFKLIFNFMDYFRYKNYLLFRLFFKIKERIEKLSTS